MPKSFQGASTSVRARYRGCPMAGRWWRVDGGGLIAGKIGHLNGEVSSHV